MMMKTYARIWGSAGTALLTATFSISCGQSEATPNTSVSVEDRAQKLYEPLLPGQLQKEEQCKVTRLFYQVTDHKGEFFWSADCQSGKSVMVSVNGNTGQTRFLDCSVAAAAKVKCFEKFR